jgi:hypothetical protein
MGGLIQFEAKIIWFLYFLFTRLSIKKCGSAMDEDLNPKLEVKVQVLVLTTYDI